MPIPTRIRVSRDARPLINRSSSQTTCPFLKIVTIVEPPIYSAGELLAKMRQDSLRHTKGKVAKFLATSDRVSLADSEDDAPHHHRTDADVEYAAEDRTVDGHDLADILAIDIERGANGLGLKELHQEREDERAVDRLTFTV